MRTRTAWKLPRRWALAAALALAGSRLPAAVTAVTAVEINVGDLERATAFYTSVLSCEIVARDESSGAELERLYALPHAATRAVRLRLGTEEIVLTQFTRPAGRAYPADSHSNDRWFQHVAIVVRDMDAAYAVLERAHVRHVSTAPQTLPLANPNAGGIRAFYFQDPEGHVLEVIWFPPGKGDPRWQAASERLFLGIDHTAIVVDDTERSLAFYRDALGFRVAGHSENLGPEQEHLNQVFGARLRITGLRAVNGPGVEFLEYVTPPGGRALPADAQVNDRVAWITRLRATENTATVSAAETAGGRRASVQSDDVLVRDPDGHLVRLSP